MVSSQEIGDGIKLSDTIISKIDRYQICIIGCVYEYFRDSNIRYLYVTLWPLRVQNHKEMYIQKIACSALNIYSCIFLFCFCLC